MDGSSPTATVNGTRITVTGPFATGTTPVQVAFQLPFNRSDVVLEQKWPAALEQVTVASQKIGSLSMTSPQFTSVGDVRADDGTTYVLANGGGLPAGGVLRIQLSGLPVHSSTPRNVALGLAFLMAAAGVWLSVTGRSQSRDSRKRLMARRDALLGDLARLEELGRNNRGTPKDAVRKQRILAELEQIYGELDDVSVGPQGGGEGLAA